MDNGEYSQLDAIVDILVLEFLKKKRFHNRIFVVSDDLKARLYVSGKMLDKFESEGRDIFIVDKAKLPDDFERGKDYAIELEWYLQDKRRRMFDLV